MSQDHTVQIPGGSLYYRTQGHGPALILIGGGASNADTLSALAAELERGYTVISYDRRGYSRSQLDDRDAPASIEEHAGDVRRILDDRAMGPVMVFGSSIGAVIALGLGTSSPDAVARLVVHEPPLGQLLTGADQATFDDDGDEEKDPEQVLNAMAGAIGVQRGAGGKPGAGAGNKARAGDIELFVRRDMPAVGRYHLDLDQLAPLKGRIAVAGGRDSRDFYPYRCAERLAEALGVPLTELPGHHAGMVQYPREFAAGLDEVLHPER